MKRISFANKNCSLSRALDVIGDWWTLSIIQEAFFGTKRFSDFQKRLGIAKNILALRLEQMTSNDLLRRESLSPEGKRTQYRLTKKGRSLGKILIALIQWGDEWNGDPENPPLIVKDSISGDKIAPLEIKTVNDKTLSISNLSVEPGPGASLETKARFTKNLYKKSAIKVRIRDNVSK
tara:strand:- start:924 stop:1457 length:534 start_codon:yes stop_codon:yes gene_type:complete